MNPIPPYQQCRKCGLRYTGDRQPLLLPCGHCLCSKCVNSNTVDKKCFHEECHASFRSHSGTYQSFPVVYKLLDYSDPNPSDVLSDSESGQSCQICMNDFDTVEHQPLLPDCGHAICKTCIVEFCHKGKGKCPQCTASIPTDIATMKVVKDLIPKAANISRRRVPPSAEFNRNGFSGVRQNPAPVPPQFTDFSKNIKISVKNMAGNGRAVSFELLPTDTVHKLRLQIQRQWHVAPTEQSIMFKNQYLQLNDKTLQDYNIVNGSELILTCRLRGG